MLGKVLGGIAKGAAVGGRAIGKQLGTAMANAEGGSNLSKFLGRKMAGIKEEESPNKKTIGSRQKGGRINRTGNYKMHKGEMVVPAKLVRTIKAGVKGTRSKNRKASRSCGRR